MPMTPRTPGGRLSGMAGTGGRLSIGRKPSVSGKAAAGPELNKAQKRMAELKETMEATKTSAKSAAHQGVVARPMDKDLSKMLEQRRAQMKGPATSVARLGKEDAANPQGTSSVGRLGEEPGAGASSVKRLGEANRDSGVSTSVARLGAGGSEESARRATSVGRLSKNEQTPSYMPPVPAPKPRAEGAQPPDIFGDL